MAEPSAAPLADTETKGEEAPGPLKFTLHVVSPSVGVSGPLNFASLPATTTVKDLKGRIRDVLPSRPPDENQRLIHRGRMLGRDAETMLEIFGQETLSNTDSQTLHLVLRPTAPEAASLPATSTPTPIHPPGIANPPIPPQFQPRPQSTPVNPLQAALHGGGIHGMQAQQPLPGFQQIMQHQQHTLNQAQQVAHLQQGMVHRLGQLQQETHRLQQEINIFEQRARAAAAAIQNGQQAPVGPGIPPQSIFRPVAAPPHFPASIQQLINQQQRERAAEGRQGAQDTGGLPHPGHFPQTASGRASPSIHRPDSTTTYTREGVGPNGERWSVTVNETTTTIPAPQPQSQPHLHHHHPAPHANPALDIQAVLRNADRFLAQNGHNNMQRSGSSPVPMQGLTSAPGINRPETPGQATPTTTNSSPSASTFLNPLVNTNLPTINVPAQAASSTSSSASNQPMVYLLSSPSGPRALLVTNSETYFTPRHSSRRRLSPTATVQGQAADGVIGLPEYRNRPQQNVRRVNPPPNAAQAPAQPIPNAPHGNPPAAAVGAQFGQIVWMLVRLAGFVWFFTSGNPSWTRWLIIVGLGVVVFLYNTGMLNGIGELFSPIRRHLENLIPLAGPEAALVPAQNAAIPQAPARGAVPGGNLTPQQRQRGELDPAEAAERILEQRRQRLANGGWLVAQIRRAEHSLLLFLASLVPGVGERHIAAREAEANAAEARRLEAIAAAEAAEQAANAEAPVEGESGVERAEGTGEQRANDTNEGENNDAAAAPVQPLIQV
ncbi:hypothetical protein ONS95_009404 [Cadophora gregata]|uniref:uncharacterized protein n=1 Tax=Cadophora gregata TaxID=51156 RepID=UPI0026DB973F|nr:uncharacterized protein ONS95_009404 [Cadophora gregata]KAK0124449.1 hypothetical protein ONS95_009404 [Cadophora gregata]KAK0129696.1 hypothetical protein ONS96_000258 [Cadophora gregata f. sp. sojae]